MSRCRIWKRFHNDKNVKLFFWIYSKMLICNHFQVKKNKMNHRNIYIHFIVGHTKPIQRQLICPFVVLHRMGNWPITSERKAQHSRNETNSATIWNWAEKKVKQKCLYGLSVVIVFVVPLISAVQWYHRCHISALFLGSCSITFWFIYVNFRTA